MWRTNKISFKIPLFNYSSHNFTHNFIHRFRITLIIYYIINEQLMSQTDMEWEQPEFTLWVVRHCDREDSNNPIWFVNDISNPNRLAYDNTPLSMQGRRQGVLLRERFSSIKLDHIFASPFERTMETASLIAEKQPRSSIKVKMSYKLICYIRVVRFVHIGRSICKEWLLLKRLLKTELIVMNFEAKEG